ncbi:tRNA preQ1(34) S-adenosylmethionine ribosyltransferase-isomerase QueA [candidate division LCP-89 bacterium B3_LCP]|uniref:S-adenosylmethionine:tRNA ribosyltransferase-isomerase n=1 Tax=candidate division LCP-89 bacterium B3_LCP TaxID=2012998 RepID=A0A532V5P9_UNCL8|nr:MAG: tRNA preQ1(34) S-adenosylmethionine ribosyltransferase-isomerase QueA [candidate division LCP-89 bacterium B3_LCP]
MRLSDFKFKLSESLIAQTPLPVRDQSRLLVLHRENGRIEDRSFREIIEYLNPGDALIVNETKVFPARLHGQKDKTDAKIEVFLLRELNDSLWEVLVRPARKVRTGNTIWFADDIVCEVVDNTTSGGRVVRFICDKDFHDIVESVGVPPLPPYIKRKPTIQDRTRYQTVYARVSGAVAAPTAGLHFTDELLADISAKGVHIIPIILHIGLGTFRPVCVEDLSRHQMDSEYYEVPPNAAETINNVITNGNRILAVGTTTTRALETVANFSGDIRGENGWTDKFIYPPYKFRIVNGLVTNFHLPGSTLIMLVSAFADRDKIMKAYRHAVRKKYRFYSYGDAMLII